MATTQRDVLTPKAGVQSRELVEKIYGVENWGFGYFFVNKQGNLAVAPFRDRRRSLDVYQTIQELAARNQTTPVLLRFPQILDDRMHALHRAFRDAIAEFGYHGKHLAVYPNKVNQKSEVVIQLLRSGASYGYGLEVGSKAELVSGLALDLSKEALIVCNGWKDDLYLRSAILAERIGKKTIVVVEDQPDMQRALELGARLGSEPELGIRVKLYSRGSGKWEESGGEVAKFGMGTIELVHTLEYLRRAEKTGRLRMLHFHVGSQITNIKQVKQAVREAARVYARVRKMGFDVYYLNVGGGLGVDYDGSKTASEFSMNYSVEEFANDVVYAVQEVCRGEGVPEPTIVTESGRAMVAYHSMLVTDVKKVVAPGGGARYRLDEMESEAEPVLELIDIAREINAKNFREYYHDALEHREDLNALFGLGYLDLEDRARGEWLFWEICRKAERLSRTMKDRPDEFNQLQKRLSAKYICNFSVFQSLPDFWAFDQLFPIMPIHRLLEEPTERGVLCDVTCDSDGSVDRFVDVRHVKEALELHRVRAGEPYYLAFLLLGAYQETLGDLHNLFGIVSEANVTVDDEGKPKIESLTRGDGVREVLEYSGYETDELLKSIARMLGERKAEGRLSDDQEHEVLATISRVLDDYTYLQ